MESKLQLVLAQGLLGPKKELWDILQTVERYTSEAADITASVRDLPVR
jgi:RUN and FYVE domain-containing protein 1